MLSSAELVQIRADINSLLTDECNILESTDTPNGQGGYRQTWGTVTGGTAVPCRLDAKSGAEIILGGGVQNLFSYTLTLGYDVTVTNANRVSVGSYTFAVTSINLGGSFLGCKRVNVERLP